MKMSQGFLSSCFQCCFLFILWFSEDIFGTSWRGCRLSNEEAIGYSLSGEITLGGLFAVHMDVEYPEVNFREPPKSIQCRKYYRYLLAMVYSIVEINNSSDLLPNVTMGFQLYDSCYNEVRSLMGTSWIISGKEQFVPNFDCHQHTMPNAIVGDMPSKASMPIARILGLYRYPQVSYASAHPLLSDKTQFPSFLRTISNDNYEVFAIARLIQYFNWTWVGIITSDNDLGRSGTQLLTKEIESNGGCIAFQEILPLYTSMESVYRIVDVLKKTKATVIIVYSTMENLIPLMEVASFNNITDKVWVGSGSWSITSDFPRREMLTTLNGSLGLAPQRGKIPGFKEFLYSIHPSKYPDDIYIKTFWELAFGCVWPANQTTPFKEGSVWCTGKEKLDSIDESVYDVYNFRYTYKIHNAVFAIAHALHQMNTCVPGHGPFKNGSCADIYNHQPWQRKRESFKMDSMVDIIDPRTMQSFHKTSYFNTAFKWGSLTPSKNKCSLLHYIKHVKFNNTAGEPIFFDENGDVPISVDILNWQLFPNGSNQYVHIGSFDASSQKGHELKIEQQNILWNHGQTQVPVSVCSDTCPRGHRRTTRQGQQICCFDCVPCSEGEILNPIDESECIKCPGDKWPDTRKEICLPKVIQFLSYEEMLGTSLAFISVLLCLLTFSVFCLFIAKRKTPIVKANNRELSYLLLISLMLCFLCSLVFIGQPNMITCIIRQVVFGIIFSVCLSVILAKTMTVILVFSATNPHSKLRRMVGLRIPMYIVPFCTMVQIALCIAWLAFAAPFTEFNMEAEIGTIVIECNEGSNAFFTCVLGYMGLLASISLLVAFLARKLPDTFNEAKFITFSMLVFASVWVTFIPAYLSTKGKHMVAVEIFAIISSSAGLLVCIFFPKCYIILIHPEMNSRQFITGKNNRKL